MSEILARISGGVASIRRIVQEVEAPSPDATPVSARTRAVVALGVGIVSGAICYALQFRPGSQPDFAYPFTAAQVFLGGRNPYEVMSAQPGSVPPFDEHLFYPFTAVLALMPLTGLSLKLASSLFLGVSSGLLSYCITRDGLWRLHVFASSPYVLALVLAQFSPLLMIVAFLPLAGFLLPLKPNLGVAILAARPTWRAIAGSLALVALSLLVFPEWPHFWRAKLGLDLGESQVHQVPFLQAGGFVLLLAAVAWRRRAGRLLLAMSVVPQLLFFYDQLLLWLIPRTRKQSIALTACSQAAMLLWFLMRRDGASVVRSAAPYVVFLIYIPALVIVLLQRYRAEPDAAA